MGSASIWASTSAGWHARCSRFTASTAQRIHLTLQADAVSVTVDTAIPCRLLVHEVLVNCVQHAFPSPHRGGGHDHPAGRAGGAGDPHRSRHRDQMVGARGGRRQRRGSVLHLIHGLTEQPHGALMVTWDQGTCVTLRFPV